LGGEKRTGRAVCPQRRGRKGRKGRQPGPRRRDESDEGCDELCISGQRQGQRTCDRVYVHIQFHLVFISLQDSLERPGNVWSQNCIYPEGNSTLGQDLRQPSGDTQPQSHMSSSWSILAGSPHCWLTVTVKSLLQYIVHCPMWVGAGHQ
jgi:hypothetical protein